MKKINVDVQKLLELFNLGKTSSEIAIEMGLTRSLVEKRKRELNIHRNNSFYKKKKCNEAYFHNIDSDDKAYWLGFLFADGCVLERKTSKIIKLVVQDKEVCDKFLNSIDANFKTMTFLEKDMYNPGKKREVYHVEIFSKQMFEDLYNLGCIPRKSLVLQFPKIDDKYISHFIRGYFDGDGYMTYGITKNKNNTSTKYYKTAFGFNGTKEFLEKLNSYLNNSFNLSKESRNPNTNTYKLVKSGTNNARKFYKYLYKDAKTYLSRKKDKFENYFVLINLKNVQRA